MRTFLFFALFPLMACAGSQKVIDAPPAPQGSPPSAKPTGIQFDIPLPDAWQDLPATPDGKRAWIHQRTGGRIEMEVRKASNGGVDAILDAELGRLRSEGKTADSLGFFSHGTLVGWTSSSGTVKGMVAARGCPEPDGPYMAVVNGSWPAEYDQEMSEDLTEMAKGITLVE
jgi:hypothetical protein